MARVEPSADRFQPSVARARAYFDENAKALARFAPLATFVAKWKDPVVVARSPIDASRVRKLGKVPPSYAAFLREHGTARFFRANPEEAAFVFSPEESLAARVRIMKACKKVFAGYARRYSELAATYGPARRSWKRVPPATSGLLSVRDVESLDLLPVCPYYDGAFCIARQRADAKGEAPFFCVSPSGDEPVEVTFYGHSMEAWFDAMVDWSITEMRQFAD